MKFSKTMLALSLVTVLNITQNADACTRFTYEGLNNEVVVGCSDWRNDLCQTNGKNTLKFR